MITLLDEIGAAGMLHAEYRHIQFTVTHVDPTLVVHNAFKYTPAGGRVVLGARAEEGRLVVEVEDECRGFPESKGDLFQVFGDRRGGDRSGLGLGLSIARKAMRAHGGDIHIRNMPGQGCVFVIDMPLAVEREASTSVAE